MKRTAPGPRLWGASRTAHRAVVSSPGFRRPAVGRRPAAGGFTLLELLLAVAIFALVLAAIHSVFFGALRLRNKTTAALDSAVPLQHALSLLRRDLTGLVPPGGTLAGPFESLPTTTTNVGVNPLLTLGGQRVSPDIYTASAIVDETSPWAEIQKVSYQLVAPTNGGAGLELVRVVTRNLLQAFDEPPEVQWLLSGVQDVFFEFYDGTQWLPTWDPTSTALPLPLAIKVRIDLWPDESLTAQPAPVELVVPVLVQGASNQVAQADSSGGMP